MQIHGFYSDPHYGHKNIIKFCERPFADAEEMNEKMVALYNEVATPTSTICWLGDCAFMGITKFKEILARMNGKKILVRGNHDKGPVGMWLDAGFDLVCDRDLVIRMGTKKVRICHFPHKAKFEGDDRYTALMPAKEPGILLMHGHTHEKVRVTEDGCLHAGVDAWDYRPATWGEMEDLAAGLG